MSIFRAYDIRGVYGEELTDKKMEKIGRVLGTYIQRKGMGDKVVLGRDVRKSSDSLSEAFVRGVISTGIDVLNTGQTSFGVTLFSGWKTDNCVTAYITASHNPPEWNGVKFYDDDCIGFFEEQNREIGRIVQEKDFVKGKEKGRKKEIRMEKEYVDYLKGKFDLNGLKVVLDCGNGSVSLVGPELFRFLGAETKTLFCRPDPEFPGRGPDVEEENLEKLKKETEKQKADLGIALDGDGDRMEVVDSRGRVLGSDKLAIILARELIKKKRRTVICNVENSMAFERELEPLGAEVIRIPVGHTYMMQEAKKHQAVLGAESAHHFVIPDIFPFDDGLVPALKLAEILKKTREKLSRMSDSIRTYPKERETLDCSDSRKFEVVERLKEKFREEYTNVNTMDGVRVDLEEGWVLIRPSNTSPVIRLTVEATERRKLKELKRKFYTRLKEEVENEPG